MATEPLRASFAKPFAEQMVALRLRLANQVGTVAWNDLVHAEHERAFVVAGALKADLLADLAKAVERAIGEHRSLDKFRAEFKQIVADRGWHGWTGEGTAKGEAWRTKVIYKTNMATSYAAGRITQLVKLNYKFWVYKHGNALEPRLQHLAWDGLALPPDHPFWATHAPPNGWGCTCRVTGADSAAGIKRAGGDPAKTLPDGWNAINPKTGTPVGIDKGWDYKVGGSVADEVNATVKQVGTPTAPDQSIRVLVEQKIQTLPAEIGSGFGTSVEPEIERTWQRWVADTLSGASHKPGLAGVISKDVLSALDDAAPASAEILVNPGLLLGKKADRHVAAGDALTDTEWLRLPILMRKPRAVLLDVKTGRLLYLLGPEIGPMDARAPQLAVSLDYKQRIDRVLATSNTVVSAYRPDLGDILARVAGGFLKLLLGEVR